RPISGSAPDRCCHYSTRSHCGHRYCDRRRSRCGTDDRFPDPDRRHLSGRHHRFHHQQDHQYLHLRHRRLQQHRLHHHRPHHHHRPPHPPPAPPPPAPPSPPDGESLPPIRKISSTGGPST